MSNESHESYDSDEMFRYFYLMKEMSNGENQVVVQFIVPKDHVQSTVVMINQYLRVLSPDRSVLLSEDKISVYETSKSGNKDWSKESARDYWKHLIGLGYFRWKGDRKAM